MAEAIVILATGFTVAVLSFTGGWLLRGLYEKDRSGEDER
jgi:hypothetical protein